jgi:subtilisin family serine protease
MKVGVIDSGVHAAHPHVNGVSGGIGITSDGREETDYVDRLGHGTAVTAVIREKAPDAQIFVVKIFHESLAARIEPLVTAIDWCVRHGMDLINLSLGTSNPSHEAVLSGAVERVRSGGGLIVAAGENEGVLWLPGSLPGVAAVKLDWSCPREEYRTEARTDGGVVYRASGYPRPAPGIPVERNLKGLSFAVANVTGLLARERVIRSAS